MNNDPMNNNQPRFRKFAMLAALGAAGILLVKVGYSLAFNGPSANPPSGSGAIVANSSNNIAIGTSTAAGDTRFFVAAPNTANDSYALKLSQPAGGALLWVRNDNVASIGQSIPGGNSTNTLLVGGGAAVNGTVTAAAFVGGVSGNVNAANVTAGVFASGNFAFPSSLGLATSTQVGLPQALSVYGGGYFSGDVGFGKTSPDYKIDVSGGVIKAGGAGAGIVVGRRDTGADAYQWYSASGNLQLWNYGAGADSLTVDTSGNVSIGTTVTSSKLTVAGTIGSTSGGFRFPDGTVQTTAASGGASGAGWTASGAYVYLSTSTNSVGIGISSPDYKLHVSGGIIKASGAGAGIVVGRRDTGADAFQWYSTSGTLQLYNYSAGTDALAVGTDGTLTVGGGSGKINAGTIDPPYTINGKPYATYLPAMTGVKEETTGAITCRFEGTTCEAVLDFAHAEEGSDLWLFSKTTNLKEQFEAMTVLATPGFDGEVWYEKKRDDFAVALHGRRSADTAMRGGSAEGEISYRLTAPRFDAEKWPNAAGEGSPAGFIINE